MILHIDLPWLLEVAQQVGEGDPTPDDYGVPIAAVERHRATLLDQPVYRGPYAQAAALAHTLGRSRWLERSNLTVAGAVAVNYLAACGINVQPSKSDALRLAVEVTNNRATAASVAAVLRSWPVQD